MEELDTTSEALDVTKYDLVYILLKYKIDNPKDLIKYDKSRKRYYLAGIIVDLPGHNYHSLQFVDEKQIKDFRKAKKLTDKQKYIHYILFGDIEFITLHFDALDWKRKI